MAGRAAIHSRKIEITVVTAVCFCVFFCRNLDVKPCIDIRVVEIERKVCQIEKVR